MRSFTEYTEAKDVFEAKEHLATRLIESQVDVAALNRGLQIILEYEYNPARTGLEVGATAAGATLGSAMGPLGAIGGGLVGGMAGKAVSGVAGKLMSGVTVDPLHPTHLQAKDAVDKLYNLIQKSSQGEPDFYKDSQRQKYIGSIKKIKDYFDTTAELPQQIDKERNQKMDMDLRQRGETQGTSVSGFLKKVEGEGKVPEFLRWLGKKVENIPVLNQEMGLRRAIAKGMDSLQVWAKQNPKKAAVLNATAGIAGAVAGVGAAGALSAPSAPDPRKIRSDSVTSRDAGDFIQRPGVVQSRDPFPSGRVDNSAAFSDSYTRTYTSDDAVRPKFYSPEELWKKYRNR